MGSSDLKYDVVIIGAGISGLSCGLTLAKAGIQTLILERGSELGAKSTSSKIVDLNVVKSYLDISLSKRHYQRLMSDFKTYIVQDDSFVVSEEKPEGEEEGRKLCSIKCSSLLKILEKEYRKHGGEIRYSSLATSVLFESENASGVQVGDQIINCKKVVLAEGKNALLTQKLGLSKGSLTSNQVMIFAQEIFQVDESQINKDFGVKEGEGKSIKLFSRLNRYNNSFGVGSLNLGKDYVTFEIGVKLKDTIDNAFNIFDYLQTLKESRILPFKSENLIGYSSYIVPMHFSGMSLPLPKMVSNGCFLVGGATSLRSVYDIDTTSYSLATGKIAADSIISGLPESYLEKLKEDKIVGELLQKIESKWENQILQ